jgi:hypothetical protein
VFGAVGVIADLVGEDFGFVGVSGGEQGHAKQGDCEESIHEGLGFNLLARFKDTASSCDRADMGSSPSEEARRLNSTAPL